MIAPWGITVAMDGPAFASYIREGLLPEIAPGSVVIQDTRATHRNQDAERALRDHDCWFVSLSPYFPDLNPSSQAFSKVKTNLRQIGARTFIAVFEAIGPICDLYNPEGCRNDVKAAAYASGKG